VHAHVDANFLFLSKRWKDVRWPQEAASGLHVRPHTSSLIQIGSIPQRQYCLIAIGT
jgi:hypothetical protein